MKLGGRVSWNEDRVDFFLGSIFNDMQFVSARDLDEGILKNDFLEPDERSMILARRYEIFKVFRNKNFELKTFHRAQATLLCLFQTS